MKPQIREKNVFTSWAPIMILVSEHFQYPPKIACPLVVILITPCPNPWQPPNLLLLFIIGSTSGLSVWLLLSSVLQNVRATFLFICMVVYMYMTVGLGAYALTLTHRSEKNIECPAPSLWHILLRQDLSWNLELGWLAVSSPPPHVTNRTQIFTWVPGIWTPVRACKYSSHWAISLASRLHSFLWLNSIV